MTSVNTLWVRHGESIWNRAGLMQGQISWPYLTFHGRRQAHAAAAELGGCCPTAIFSSDLRRAAETAAIIGARLDIPVTHDVLLRERSWGVYEGQPAGDGNRTEATLRADQPVPQGESRADVARRLRCFATDTHSTAGPVVIVTHGDVIREAVAMWAFDRATTVAPNGSVIHLAMS